MPYVYVQISELVNHHLFEYKADCGTFDVSTDQLQTNEDMRMKLNNEMLR